jgi:hypothetical protein
MPADASDEQAALAGKPHQAVGVAHVVEGTV